MDTSVRRNKNCIFIARRAACVYDGRAVFDYIRANGRRATTRRDRVASPCVAVKSPVKFTAASTAILVADGDNDCISWRSYLNNFVLDSAWKTSRAWPRYMLQRREGLARRLFFFRCLCCWYRLVHSFKTLRITAYLSFVIEASASLDLAICRLEIVRVPYWETSLPLL